MVRKVVQGIAKALLHLVASRPMGDSPELLIAGGPGARIGYLAWRGTGAGRVPVLLVPGMAGSAESWKRCASLLAALREGGARTVLALSARGRKGSECPDTGWTVDDHVSDLLAVLDAENVTRAHVIGHSMGGFFALRLAATHPERVLSLVVGDFGTRVGAVEGGWRERLAASATANGCDRRMPAHLAREWRAVDLAKDGSLARVAAPLLVLRATRGDSLISATSTADFLGLRDARMLAVRADHEGVFEVEESVRACAEHVRDRDKIAAPARAQRLANEESTP